jgi:thymidylate kinase
MFRMSDQQRSQTHRPSLVIKFDGIDGCGKSTLISSVFELVSGSLRTVKAAEFGGAKSDIGEFDPACTLRDIALNPAFECDDVERQLLLNVVSRRFNRMEVARLAREFDLVLVDRSWLSNAAYGRAIDSRFDCIAELSGEGVLSASVVFWIDTPVSVCVDRIKKKQPDMVERKGATYLHRVREVYLELSKVTPCVVVLDGTKDVSSLTYQVANHISNINLDDQTEKSDL